MTVEVTTLPSGLRIATDDMPDLRTAALGVWIGVGSRHETEDEQGISHLIEHMAFKGTARRGARAIAEEIEAVGGDLNAATGVENTAFYAHLLAEDVPLALDILADIVTQSTFDGEELTREKSVILQEIGSVEDTPDDLVFDLFNAAAFPDQAIGRAILGTARTVARFDPPQIRRYLGQSYKAPAIVVAAAGAVDHARVVEDTARHFGTLIDRAKPPEPPAACYRGGDVRMKRRLEQAHIVLGWEGLALDDRDFYALQVFSNAVGGGMSCRLFQEVRETRGLAYNIYAFNWAYADTGVFGVYAATSGPDVKEVAKVTLASLAEATENLKDDEIQRAKAQMKVSILVGLESSSSRAEQIARHILAYGRVVAREEMIARIERLEPAAIRSAGRRALASKPTVASIGPIAAMPTADRIAEALNGLGSIPSRHALEAI